MLLAATAEALDGEAFVAELVARGAVPFATRPVTLRMLLGMCRRGEALPNRMVELYERGCLWLCEETEAKRRKTARPAGHRLAVARRVAALMIFGRRPAIDVRPAHAADAAALRLAEIAGSVEVVGEEEFPVTEADVHDVLESALFRSAGQGRYTFAHWTYAEFLAASYPIVRGLSDERVLALVRHPGFPGVVVPPPLAETAAWLGSHSPALFRALVSDNSDLMLRSDVATADDADRALLVDAYLTACAEGRVQDWEPGRARLYARLAYTGLADQLRPWIWDRHAHLVARRAAMEIAEACIVAALECDLLAVVLNTAENPNLRSKALAALVPMMSADSRRALFPVALGELGEDPSDELRGRALPLVWPDILDTPTMMASLIFPKRDNLIGWYSAEMSKPSTRFRAMPIPAVTYGRTGPSANGA